MQVICFEDSLVEKLRPISQARPAYAVTCASLRLIDCLKTVFHSIEGQVRPFLGEIQRLDEWDALSSRWIVCWWA